MNTVVITGATSFIGKNVLKELLKQDYFVYAVVRNPQKIAEFKESQNLRIIACDLNQIEELPQKIDDKIDIFYHLAWDGTRASARADVEKQNINLLQSIVVMNVAKMLGCHTFIGAGSQAEYGQCEGIITEEYPAMPMTEYGKAKLAVYQKGCDLLPKAGIKFIWTRIFSVYGVGDYEGTLVSTAINKMLKNEPMKLTECTQTWDFVHVSDVARAFVKLIGAPAGVYNVANGDYRMLRDFVMRIKDLTQSQSELLFGAIPYGATGKVSFQPDASKLKNTVNWKPIVDFDEGIKEIIQEQRKAND